MSGSSDHGDSSQMRPNIEIEGRSEDVLHPTLGVMDMRFGPSRHPLRACGAEGKNDLSRGECPFVETDPPPISLQLERRRRAADMERLHAEALDHRVCVGSEQRGRGPRIRRGEKGATASRGAVQESAKRCSDHGSTSMLCTEGERK